MSNILSLPGSSLAYEISKMINHSPLAVIAKDSRHANNLFQEIRHLASNKKICILPSWELLPYDHYSAHNDVISMRLQTLNQLTHNPPDLVILTPETWMMRLPPKSYIERNVMQFRVGDQINRKSITQTWNHSGYDRVSQVTQTGEYTIRGSIIDIFPQGSKYPFRIDIFDDQIESIRTFNPHTQLSISKIKYIDVLPLGEFDLENISVERLKERAALQQLTHIPDKLLLRKPFPGIEFYLPLLHDQLFEIEKFIGDYQCLVPDDIEQLISKENKLIREQFLLKETGTHLRPDLLWRNSLPQETSLKVLSYNTRDTKEIERVSSSSKEKTIDLIKQQKTIIACSMTSSQIKLIAELSQYNLQPHECDSIKSAIEDTHPISVCIGQISDSFIHHKDKLTLLNDQIFRSHEPTLNEKITEEDHWFDQSTLEVGDYCVHPKHGIGQFIGVEQIDNDPTEFLKLRFADDGHIFVNISAAYQLKPYFVPANTDVKLDKLNGKDWEKRKQKAKKNIELIAAKLLKIYSQHQKSEKPPAPKNDDFDVFCDEFPFTPTPDQIKATHAITQDASGTSPVTRLLCADVGFGKTEIMMRSSFLHVSSHQQVIILAPTTLLAEQHYERFLSRFKNWPIEIARLNRSQGKALSTATIEKFNQQKIDILIGTHKLLFQNLNSDKVGLVIVDEEHRFGVRQKNHFVDHFPCANFLNVSATPIPRSMGLAFGKMMKLSLMNTPPPKRHAINTEIHPLSNGLIKTAITREIHRGGSVFYVLNRISPLESRLEQFKALMPDIEFGIIHGQMRPQVIEQTMDQFIRGNIQVLLTTAIIESGIDIPSANTILVERADLFGISQLHQLRGRIGRSHHVAYAYLLTDESGIMTKDAEHRLNALAANQNLGAGYRLATQDMELRGVGEILGEKQSGHIREIGYSTYVELLDECMDEKNSKHTKSKCDVQLENPGVISSRLIPELNERILLYRKLNDAKASEQVQQIEAQLIDRFGTLDDGLRNLIINFQLQIQLNQFKIKRLVESSDKWTLLYHQHEDIPSRFIPLLQENTSCEINGPTSINVFKSASKSAYSLSVFLDKIHA